jgi:hypothetical protein
MLKRILLLAGVALTMIVSVSADIPIPPCDPNCAAVTTAAR